MSRDSDGFSSSFVTGLFTLGGVVITSITTLMVAGLVNPSFVRLDFLFPQQEIHVIDDFVLVKITGYADRRTQPPIDKTETGDAIYDKASFVEHVRLRKSKNANYRIHLESSGIVPRVLAISPDVATPQYSESNGLKMVDANLALSQNSDYADSNTIENIKMLYEFRNGYQPPDNSNGGKVIKYPTDRLTLVYDFSSVVGAMQTDPPTAVIERKDKSPEPLPHVEWHNNVATLTVFNQQPGCKVKLYWKWRDQPKVP